MLRPVELLVGALIASAFVGVIVLMGTRDLMFAGISTGIVFIVVLVVMAMFSLTAKPGDAEVADLNEQNHDGDERRRGH